MFSVLGLSDQAIHDAHGYRGLLADRHGLGAAASRPEPWMNQCPPCRRDAAPVSERRDPRRPHRVSLALLLIRLLWR